VALDLAGMCKQLRVLPGPGGVFDQDSYHMYLLRAGLQAINTKEKRDMEAAKKH
jgi:hypothetical protein